MPVYSLPPYAFIPGLNHHPTRHPLGHSFSRAEFEPGDPSMSTWPMDPLWSYGFRLFNRGYYWEAHEVWEAFWLRAEGAEKTLISALIGIAASGVKVRQGHFVAAHRLLDRNAHRIGLMGDQPVLEMAPAMLLDSIKMMRAAVAEFQERDVSPNAFVYEDRLNPRGG